MKKDKITYTFSLLAFIFSIAIFIFGYLNLLFPSKFHSLKIGNFLFPFKKLWLLSLGFYLLAQLLYSFSKNLSFFPIMIFILIGMLFSTQIVALDYLHKADFIWGIFHFQYFKLKTVALFLPLPFIATIPIIARITWKISLKFTNFLEEKLSKWNRRLLAWQLGLLCFFAFWYLGNNNPLGDAGPIMGHFAMLVKNKMKPHITFDETLEWFFHAKLFHYTYHHLGWGQAKTYGITTSLAGVIFMVLLFGTGKYFRLEGDKSIIFAGLIATGAFMQLFFRYVENYTNVTLCILVYLILLYRSLTYGKSLVWASFIIGLASCFHILAGWLYPTLLFSFIFMSLKRRWWKTIIELFLILIAFVLPFLILFGYLQYIEGYSVKDIIKSSWFYKLNFVPFKASYEDNYWLLSARHLLDIINEQLLLAPLAIPAILLLLIFKFKKINFRDPFLHILIIGSVFMLIFSVVWMPGLGGYRDWDLFSPAGLLICALLGWLIIHSLKDDEGQIPLYWMVGIPLILAHLIHTAAWILSNHLDPRGY